MNDFTFNGGNGSNYEDMKTQDLVDILGRATEIEEEELVKVLLELFSRDDEAHLVVGTKEHAVNVETLREHMGNQKAAELLAKIFKHGSSGSFSQYTTEDLKKALDDEENGTATSEQKAIIAMLAKSLSKKIFGDKEDNEEEASIPDDIGNTAIAPQLMTHILLVISDYLKSAKCEKLEAKELILSLTHIINTSFTLTPGNPLYGKSIYEVPKSVEKFTKFLLDGIRIYRESDESVSREEAIVSMLYSIVALMMANDGNVANSKDEDEIYLAKPGDIGKAIGILNDETEKILNSIKRDFQGPIIEKVDREYEKSAKNAKKKKTDTNKDIRDMLMDD